MTLRLISSSSVLKFPFPSAALWKRNVRCAVVILPALLFFVRDIAYAQAPAPTSTVSYYGVYLAKGKLGSATITRDPHALRDGKAAIRTEMRMRMDLNVGGVSGKIETTDISWTDPKSGAPVASDNQTVASGRVTHITTTYSTSSLTYIADVQGTTRTDTISLPPGKHFLADPTDGADIKPSIGMRFSGEVFVPELFRLVDADIFVSGKETIDVDGTAISAFKIIDHNSIETSNVYADEDGGILRIDNTVAGAPMQIRKEPKAMALADPGKGDAPDIIALTTIRPTGESMDDARKANAITYHISGISHPLAPTDTVQSVIYAAAPSGAAGDPAARDAEVVVRARPLPLTSGARLFARTGDAPAALRPFLQATPYIAADDPAFRALAKRVLGGETDCARAARKIADYVHRTVKPDPSIAALRTATDVRDDPRGVCRDYTAFFTAIARGAGLPTKECVGLGYANGSFLGHAWPEVWVGRDPLTDTDHWVALEPTWGVPFADATHIKLAEGEITDFFTVSGDMGNYRIRVVKVQ